MAYTAIIAAADLTTVIYQEIIDEITRSNDAIVTEDIDRAIEEVKSFLSRFDLDALFGNEDADTAATVTDKFLNGLLKDVALWNLIKLANPNVNYEHIKGCYEGAIKTLTRIQKVQQTPARWPLADPADVEVTQGNPVSFNSVAKRKNNW